MADADRHDVPEMTRARMLVATTALAALVATGCGAGATPSSSGASGGTSAPSTTAPSAQSSSAPTIAATASPTTAASGQSSEPAPLLTIQVDGPGPNELYAFGPDVSAADRAVIQDWNAYGVRWQEVMFGREFTTFTTIASNDLRWVAEKDCESRPPSMPNCVQQQMDIYGSSVSGGCHPAPDAIGCFIASWLGVEGPDEPWFKQLQFAHEAHHVLFGQIFPQAWEGTMVPFDQVWTTGPVWLLEGAATWVGEHAAIDRGLISYSVRRAEWDAWSDRVDRPLSQLETLAQEQQAGFSYWLYALALEELIERAPDGPDSLMTYYEAVARGTAWKSAFQQAFGMSVADFYAYFEDVRP